MIYELRVYHAMPGKLASLIDRFASHTVRLWGKHNIRAVGFWTVDIGGNTNDLYYILEWDDLSHRDRSAAAFAEDQDWLAVRNESEKGGPLVSGVTRTLLKPTAFSALK